ncbi:M1 family metallopeptidase [Actinokineospora auranticolor]|uniref:Aminopeptidase N n=1 Tax=Actinokineospora auranticolor TaxID=155976 RepID=A0A2S6GE78_9PSEU|nr:M1 family metallopeptidase [Actinokineospora auranticolor]PPK63537.1 peptidase M1-like protein [Actinokineospora auranticolor]
MPRVRVVLVLVAALAFTACTDTAEPGTPKEAPGGSPGKSPAQSPISVAGAAGIGDPYYPDDGNGGYDVLAYDVGISYDPATKHLDGDTTVTATASADLSQYNLDLSGLVVSAVEVDGAPAEFTRTGDRELVITPAAVVRSGARFRTRVTYAGEPTARGDAALGPSGWQIAKSGGAFAAGEPHSASSWYPVNDHPLDKATFRLTARVPDGWSVISNGREQPPSSSGGWTTFTWEEPTRVAPYLTTVGIDKWTIERSQLPDGTPVVDAYAPGAEGKKQIEARLPEVLAFLSTWFGPYPQSAAGGIFVNESIGFSLETQTRPIYAQWAELDVIVHEQAHQWFGDSVSLTRWSDICLNECLASYAQWLWLEHNGTNLDDRFRAVATRAKDPFWNRPLVDMGPGNEFTAVYDKGQLAVHALRRQLGEEKFTRLLREWAATHRDGNAGWADFEAMVNRIAEQDLTPFLDAWFHQPGKPADQFRYPGTLRK